MKRKESSKEPSDSISVKRKESSDSIKAAGPSIVDINVVLPVSSPVPDAKKRRGTLGTAVRVRTPVKSKLDKENNVDELECPRNSTGAEIDPQATGLPADGLRHSRRSSTNNSSVGLSDDLSSSKSRRSSSAGSAGAYRRDSVLEEELKERPWTVGDFTLGKPLGKGKFGNVYQAKQRLTGATIALKVLFKAPMIAANCVGALRREVEIQSKFKHPNITKLHGYVKNIIVLHFYPKLSFVSMISYTSSMYTFCRNMLRIGISMIRRASICYLSTCPAENYSRDYITATPYSTRPCAEPTCAK